MKHPPTLKSYVICTFRLPSSSGNGSDAANDGSSTTPYDFYYQPNAAKKKPSLFQNIKKKISETAEKVVSDKYNCRAFGIGAGDEKEEVELSRTEDIKLNGGASGGASLNFHLPLFLGLDVEDEPRDSVRIGLFKGSKRIFSSVLNLNEYATKSDLRNYDVMIVGDERDLSSIAFKGFIMRKSFFAGRFQHGWSLTDPLPTLSHYSPSASCKVEMENAQHSQKASLNPFSKQTGSEHDLLNLGGSMGNNNIVSSNQTESSPSRNIYNYPLTAMYSFTKNNNLYTAVERTVESTVVLPAATATLKAMIGTFLCQSNSVYKTFQVSLRIEGDLIDFLKKFSSSGSPLRIYEATENRSGQEMWCGDGEQLLNEPVIQFRSACSHLLISIQSRSNPPEVIIGTIDLRTLNSQSTVVPIRMYTRSGQIGTVNMVSIRKPIELSCTELASHSFLTPEEIGDTGSDWLWQFKEKREDDFTDLRKLANLYCQPSPLDFDTPVRFKLLLL